MFRFHCLLRKPKHQSQNVLEKKKIRHVFQFSSQCLVFADFLHHVFFMHIFCTFFAHFLHHVYFLHIFCIFVFCLFIFFCFLFHTRKAQYKRDLREGRSGLSVKNKISMPGQFPVPYYTSSPTPILVRPSR